MRCAVLLPLVLGLGACSAQAPDAAREADPVAQDPVIARALHDPLMSDPDLASRNEANAAVGFVASHALPVIAAGAAEARAAREALRLELLEGGPIPDLPPATGGKAAAPLRAGARAAELLAAVGAPGTCAAGLRDDFMLAADLPPVAALPRGGMVVQAAGADGAGCRIRIIAYRSAAPGEDLLHYHHARAVRAGLTGERRGESIVARGGGSERLAVHVRPALHGLNAVTLVYRAP